MDSQRVLCTYHPHATDPFYGQDVKGYSAKYVNIVRFPAADLKRRKARLNGFIAKPRPDRDPASNQIDSYYSGGKNDGFDAKAPPNGCQAR